MEPFLKPDDLPEPLAADTGSADLLNSLLRQRTAAAAAVAPQAPQEEPALQPPQPMWAPVVGRLVAISREGGVPLVVFEGAGPEAQPARATVDLGGAHVGHEVLLVFERGDPRRPIVTGVLRGAEGWPAAAAELGADVEADGSRLVVSAREQLVLRCGRASITLTRSGKVVIDGEYVLSRATGVNRIHGGAVQLN